MLSSEYLKIFYAMEVKPLECNYVYEMFEDFCNIYGFQVYRQDKHGPPGDIKKQIFDEIDNSHYFVADVTTRNPNVMVELGYALKKLGPDKILLFHRESGVRNPFDIISHKTLFYDLQIDTKKNELEKIKNQLLYFFRESKKRIGFRMQEEDPLKKYEVLFHFPKDTPDFEWWPSDIEGKTDGGQRLNDFGNILISHDDRKGNWGNKKPDGSWVRRPDKRSFMVLIPRKKTETIEEGDKLILRIRACLRKADRCDSIFICDGKKIEIDGCNQMVWVHGWTRKGIRPLKRNSKDSFQVIGKGEFDVQANPFYKKKGEYIPTDKYKISEHGINIGLGTEIEKGSLEISEIILIRERERKRTF